MADKDELEKVHQEGTKRFEEIMDRERDERQLAVEDARFVHVPDGQWDENAVKKRENRPRYTINRIAGALAQLIGDRRQNRTDIKVRPVSGGADKGLAKIYNGLIRNIESQSKAENAYDGAFDEIITGGYGGWRVLTEFADDDVFEQDIRIKPLDSASTSLFFGPAREYDKRDANYAFVSTLMTDEEFKTSFPDAIPVSFDQDIIQRGSRQTWIVEKMIRVVEYWVKVPVTKRIGLMSNGAVLDLDDEANVLDEMEAQGVTLEKERTAQSHKVVMYKLSGAEVLEGPSEWAGKFIPLVPAFGKVSRIEGVEYVQGMVRIAKDPQRIYNYSKSAAIEAAALTPKDPIWITAKQAAGHTSALESFNVKNQPFMMYNSDPEAPGAPQRTGAPSVQSALIQQEQQASLDIYATTGIEPASLGNSPELKSGKAIVAQQKMGDRGSFIYTDNLNKSIEYTGEILVDLIPKIYDTQRVVRTLNIDGTSDEVTINENSLAKINQTITDEQTGKQEIVNDLSRGKYDVVVDTGPAFATQRQESAQQLIDLTANSPLFADLSPDLLAKSLDLIEGDELTNRVRAHMIKQGTVKPTKDEIKELGLDQQQQPSESEQALLDNVLMQNEKLMAEIENIDAKNEKLRSDITKQNSDINKQTIDAMSSMLDNFAKQIQAGVPLTPQDHANRVKQNDLIDESQQVLDEGPNSEQAADIVSQLQQLPQQ